jgi:hypothetical protein
MLCCGQELRGLAVHVGRCEVGRWVVLAAHLEAINTRIHPNRCTPQHATSDLDASLSHTLLSHTHSLSFSYTHTHSHTLSHALSRTLLSYTLSYTPLVHSSRTLLSYTPLVHSLIHSLTHSPHTLSLHTHPLSALRLLPGSCWIGTIDPTHCDVDGGETWVGGGRPDANQLFTQVAMVGR